MKIASCPNCDGKAEVFTCSCSEGFCSRVHCSCGMTGPRFIGTPYDDVERLAKEAWNRIAALVEDGETYRREFP